MAIEITNFCYVKHPITQTCCVSQLVCPSHFWFTLPPTRPRLGGGYTALFLVGWRRLYNGLCPLVGQLISWFIPLSLFAIYRRFLYNCPCPPACSLGSRVSGLVLHFKRSSRKVTRPDTRQSSRGQLGRSISAKTARNSKMLGRDGRTDQHGKV